MTTRYLALCGIIGPILFTILVVIGSLFYPGYSHMSQAISELGGVESPNPIIQNVNFFVIGLTIIAFAFGLHQSINNGKGSILGPSLIIIFGILTIIQAFLPVDAGGEWITLIGSLHNAAGLLGFLLMISGIFIISRRLTSDSNWKSYRTYSVITAIIGLIGLVAWIGIAKAARIESVNGLLQRIFIATILSWIEITAFHMFSPSRRSANISL